MVFEATYLVAALTPGHASACCGQYDAQISKVLRPTNRSNGMFICPRMTVPPTSGINDIPLFYWLRREKNFLDLAQILGPALAWERSADAPDPLLTKV